MKNLKKVLALVVVFTMVLSTVAFASYPDVDATADYAGAVELLSALSILKGDDTGNFNPDQNITRAEFAAVVCRALGLEGSANGAKGVTDFTDVAADHWASGYINLASQQKIINGMGDGTFAPEDNVTYTQAVKMLVVAMGYEPMAEKKGGYPAGYLATANSIGLTEGVPSTASDVPALRSTVAMLTANAMELPLMEQSTYGTDSLFNVYDGENYPFKSLLTNMNIYVATGLVGELDENQTVELTVTQKSDDGQFYNYDGDGKFQKYDVTLQVNDSNIADYKNEKVNAYVEKKNSKFYVVAVVPSEEGTTLELDVDQIEDANINIVGDGYVEYYESDDSNNTSKLYIGKKTEDVQTGTDNNGDPIYTQRTVEDLTIYVNGVKETSRNFASVYAAYKNNDATIKFIENGNDKYYDVVEFTVYEYVIVSEVDANKDRIVFDAGSVSFADILDDDAYTIAFKDAEGNDITIADFAEDDVVAVVGENVGTGKSYKPSSTNETITYYNLGDSTVVGTVGGLSVAEGYIVIDGTEYDVVPDAAVVGSTKGFELGDEGAYFLTMSGKVFKFDGKRGSTTKYGYILGAGANDDPIEGDTLYVKILTTDMGVVTVNAYSTFEYTTAFNNGVGNTITIKASDNDLTAKQTAFENLYKKTDGTASNAQRLVSYKLNSSNQLKSIEVFEDADTIAANKSYNADLSKIDGKELDAGVKIFAIDSTDLDDSYVTTLSVLADDTIYAGLVADKDVDENTYAVAVITSGLGEIDRSQGISIAYKVNTTTYEGDPAVEVYAYADSNTEGTKLIFTDDCTNKGNVDVSALNAGSVFLYTADENGVVTSYVVLGTVNATTKVLDLSQAGLDYAKNMVEGTHTEVSSVLYDYAYGYISTIKNGVVTLLDTDNDTNNDAFRITSAANQYTYQYKGRAATITVDDYADGEVDNYDSDKNKANFVLIKLADGGVTDIYTFSTRVTPNSVSTAAEEVVEVEEVEVEVEEVAEEVEEVVID